MSIRCDRAHTLVPDPYAATRANPKALRVEGLRRFPRWPRRTLTIGPGAVRRPQASDHADDITELALAHFDSSRCRTFRRSSGPRLLLGFEHLD